MDKHTKQVSALEALFSQVLHRVPQENRRLALALFKAAMAVVLRGSDQIGSAFAARALAWNGDGKTRSDQATWDMRAYQTVERIRSAAKAAGNPMPALSRLDKKNRPSAFRLAADYLKSDASTVDAAYYRHKELRQERRRKS
jgi:hypothetical protein